MSRSAALNDSANRSDAARAAAATPATVTPTGATPAGAAGRYQERPPLPALRELFVCTWAHRMPEDVAPPVLITADATIDLQWIDGRPRIAGPDRACQTETLAAGTTIVGFRFRPAVAAAWLGLPAAEVVDRRVWLDELWGAPATALARILRDAEEQFFAARLRDARPPSASQASSMSHLSRIDGDAEALAALSAALEAALAAFVSTRATASALTSVAGRVDTVMRGAHQLIAQGPPPGAPLVPWLGRALAMSERTLRRRFEESFGYGPKTLDRILRYQRFLRLSREQAARAGATPITLAQLAAEAGYADQAHLARESRRIAGITPQALDRLLRAMDAPR